MNDAVLRFSERDDWAQPNDFTYDTNHYDASRFLYPQLESAEYPGQERCGFALLMNQLASHVVMHIRS